MKATRSDIYEEFKDHIQIGVYNDLPKRILDRWINEVLAECWPKYRGVLRIETTVPTLTEEDYQILLPEQLKTVCEVILKDGGMTSDGEILDANFRMTDYWLEEHGDGKYIKFGTTDWKGDLVIAGECVLHFPETDEEGGATINVPSLSPVIHMLAARYYNRRKNAMIRNGDRAGIAVNERSFTQERQLGEIALDKVRMPRMTNRTEWSVRDIAREYSNVYKKYLDLPVV